MRRDSTGEDMSDYTISIPDALYKKAQRVAKQNSQSVDTIICIHLEDALDQPMLNLPSHERHELQALSYLSDDALWTMAREQMQSEVQASMSQLMDKHSKGTITEDELRNLSELVERGQRLTLRKSQAMKLLMDRGYTVSLDALQPIHE